MTVPTRRAFLSSLAAAGAMAPFAKAATPSRSSPGSLRILVLGGTAFLGPPFVRAAVAKGHSVTLFNRGKTAPEMFADLEQLRGDRDTGDLEALKGTKFDVVVDNSGYVPAHVAAVAEMFKDIAAHYQFISTISVYGGFGERPEAIDETVEPTRVSDEVAAAAKTIREAYRHYGALKARCEAAAEAAMPGRVSNIRPGLIVGPGDRSDRFTWWPVRIDRGGEVLAPGDRDGHSQFIDVRDLANWMLHCIEQNVTGVMNAVGFNGRVSMAEVLGACKCATSKPVTLTWASEEFLQENGVGAYMDMPLWIPRAGRSMVSNARAVANGLEFRPIADTIRDTLHWARTERGERPFTRTGLRPEREAELLAKWHASQDGGEAGGQKR
ncbi:MAG: NAD-dependent epimerase/dehydratase family protein [Planctomycetes bacterium]|nr:NAD-dependent epimerase/dehydratase family protein [Planctomycetota bacterium]